MKRTDFERIYGGDKGSVVKQDRFVSSSRDVDVALEFATKNQAKMRKSEIQVIFEIKSKNGRDIEGISEFNGKFAVDKKNQQEVTFLNNTPFNIDDKEQVGNVVWVKLTEL